MLLRRRIQLSLAALVSLVGASGLYLNHVSARLHALNVRLFIDAPSLLDAQKVESGLHEIASVANASGPGQTDPQVMRLRMRMVLDALDAVDRHAQTREERSLIAALRQRMLRLDPAQVDPAVVDASISDAKHVTAFNRAELQETLARSSQLTRLSDRAAAVFAVGGLLVSAIIFAILWHSISVPVSRLFAVVRRIEEGDDTVRVGGGPDDELGRLARALDAMLDAEARREEDMAAFVAGIAHDIRTPLTTIAIAVENLRRSLDDPETIARTAVVDGQVARLDRLLDELLGVSQIAAGSRAVPHEVVALHALAADAVSLFRDLSTRHRVTLEVEPAHVRGAPDQLMRVLVNLLSNAIKYSPQGGAVEVCVRRAGAQAEVSVRDEGIGIAPSARPKIFCRFTRLEADSHIPGSGLGLFLARRIARQHAGELDFESEPGHGSRFYLRLPLAREDDVRPGSTARILPAQVSHENETPEP